MRSRSLLAVGLSAAILGSGCSANDTEEGRQEKLGDRWADARTAIFNYCKPPRTKQEFRRASDAIGSYAAQRNFVIDRDDIGESPTYSRVQAEEFRKDYPRSEELFNLLDCLDLPAPPHQNK